MKNVISLAEVKKRKMIAQYMKFYGTTYENTRKVAKKEALR